jgi:hypothetical protein
MRKFQGLMTALQLVILQFPLVIKFKRRAKSGGALVALEIINLSDPGFFLSV